MSNYYEKYLKYKNKYLNLQKEMYGASSEQREKDRKKREEYHNKIVEDGAKILCINDNQDCNNPNIFQYYKSLSAYKIDLKNYNKIIKDTRDNYDRALKRFKDVVQLNEKTKKDYDKHKGISDSFTSIKNTFFNNEKCEKCKKELYYNDIDYLNYILRKSSGKDTAAYDARELLEYFKESITDRKSFEEVTKNIVKPIEPVKNF